MKSSIRADLHIHSKYSGDGVLEPNEIVRIAIGRGLGAIAVTDHNTIRGGQAAQQCAGGRLQVIIGAEIATDKGDLIGLFLSHEIASRRFYDVSKEVHAQGGIVVIPHPFDTLRHSAFHITPEYVSYVQALEVFNARCLRSGYNKQALEFATRHKLAAIGGSDAHYSNEIGLAGVVTFHGDVRNAILRQELEIFGQRSSWLNHARTKTRKLWRQASTWPK